MHLNISVNNLSSFAGMFYLPYYFLSERTFYLWLQTLLQGFSHQLKEQITTITVRGIVSYVLFRTQSNYLESDCVKDI